MLVEVSVEAEECLINLVVAFYIPSRSKVERRAELSFPARGGSCFSPRGVGFRVIQPYHRDDVGAK